MHSTILFHGHQEVRIRAITVEHSWNWLYGAVFTVIGFALLIGLALFFIGLVVTFPLIGHASWHAYRDLVEREP